MGPVPASSRAHVSSGPGVTACCTRPARRRPAARHSAVRPLLLPNAASRHAAYVLWWRLRTGTPPGGLAAVGGFDVDAHHRGEPVQALLEPGYLGVAGVADQVADVVLQLHRGGMRWEALRDGGRQVGAGGAHP